jgi:hypothetical protein
MPAVGTQSLADAELIRRGGCSVSPGERVTKWWAHRKNKNNKTEILLLGPEGDRLACSTELPSSPVLQLALRLTQCH